MSFNINKFTLSNEISKKILNLSYVWYYICINCLQRM